MRGSSGRIQCVRAVYEGSPEGDRGRVLDAEVEGGRRREDTVVCWSIGDVVADNFADFEGAGLVEEEHSCCCWCSRSFVRDVEALDWVWMEF